MLSFAQEGKSNTITASNGWEDKDNVIFVAPFTASAGTQIDLSIEMKNTVPIRGWQFDLYLPKGMTAVTNAKGRFQVTMNADRLPADDEHTLSISQQADGAIRFLCGSQYDETFTGNSGEIATLKVDVASDMANDDYTIQLKKMKLTETDISKYYPIELIESTVTIGGTAGIEAVENGPLTIDKDAPAYNLAGQKVGKNYKGIVIKNGKKYVK